MDYYAYLVSKGLAAYEFNLKKREMEIEIKIDKWEQFLSNGRYGLASPQNAELSVTKMHMEISWLARNNKIAKEVVIISFVLEIKIATHTLLR